jgi:nucleoside-diphosphate-sugar epimerase
VSIVITGASGFLGRALYSRARAAWPHASDRFVLLDRSPPNTQGDDRATAAVLDLCDLHRGERWLAEADIVFHLAAIPGGDAERNPRLSKAVNLDATLNLVDALTRRAGPVRFVYASTIAVFGAPLPRHIDDETTPVPAMTYGAHKLMVEIALANATRLGHIDAVALRLPGIVARPAGDTSMRSAFMSELFHACAAHRSFVVPVSPEATVWLMSASCVADNLIQAARIVRGAGSTARALTLPALRTTMLELVGALAERTGGDPGSVTFEPDEALEAQFGRLPTLATPAADALGFRHDGDLATLCTRVLAGARDAAREGASS